jgi:hypothetical protein
MWKITEKVSCTQKPGSKSWRKESRLTFVAIQFNHKTQIKINVVTCTNLQMVEFAEQVKYLCSVAKCNGTHNLWGWIWIQQIMNLIFVIVFLSWYFPSVSAQLQWINVLGRCVKIEYTCIHISILKVNRFASLIASSCKWWGVKPTYTDISHVIFDMWVCVVTLWGMSCQTNI